MIRILNITLLISLFSFYFLYSTISAFLMLMIRITLCYNQKLQRKFTMRIKVYWLHLTMTLFNFYLPKQIYVRYNKEIFKKKRCIVLSNHITNYDWLFLMTVLHSLGKYESIFIILKESLRKIPIYGYCMDIFGYIFLKRDWKTDKKVLSTGLRNMVKEKEFYLLLFPEGTFIDHKTHSKSNTFSKKNNIQVNNEIFCPNEVLLPRKTGFEMIYKSLKDEIDGIIDITLLINPYEKYPSQKFTIWNVFIERSRDLNILFQIDYIPNSKEIGEPNWIYSVFKNKEDMINLFKTEDKTVNNLDDYIGFCSKSNKKEKNNYGFEKLIIWSQMSYFIISFSCCLFLLMSYFMLSRLTKLFN